LARWAIEYTKQSNQPKREFEGVVEKKETKFEFGLKLDAASFLSSLPLRSESASDPSRTDTALINGEIYTAHALPRLNQFGSITSSLDFPPHNFR